MGKKERSLTLAVECVQASYIAMQCLSTTFFVQAYQRFGIDKMTISLIVMLCNAVSIFFQPVWGHLVDRNDRPRETVLFCCGFSAIAYFVLMYSGGTVWLITAMAMLFYATFHCMMSLIDSWVARLIQDGLDVNYGQTRSIACVVYAVVAVAFGAAVTRFSQIIAPYCFLALYMLLCVGLFHVPNPAAKRSDGEEKLSVRETMRYLRGNHSYIIVVIAMFLCTFTSSTISTFFSVHVFELGGNELLVGIGTFIWAISEFPFMFLFSRIRQKLRCSSMALLAIAMCFYSVHAFLLGCSQRIGLVLAVSLFHGLSYGIYQPAQVMFVVENVDRRHVAMAQMLMHALGQSLPSVLASPVGGAISTLTSTGRMLCLMSICALMGSAVIPLGKRFLLSHNYTQ